MKAIRVHAFGGPEVMKLEDVADPTPRPTQVLVANRAIGVNPVDTYIRAGKYGEKKFPYTPGADAAGVVESAMVKPATNVAVCLQGKIKGWKVVPPPHGGFWAKLDVKLKAG